MPADITLGFRTESQPAFTEDVIASEQDTLTYVEAPKALALNDIAQVTLRTADPLPVEAYRPGGAVGSLLIIDPADGTTLSAGMVGDRRAALHPTSAATHTQSANQEESA